MARPTAFRLRPGAGDGTLQRVQTRHRSIVTALVLGLGAGCGGPALAGNADDAGDDLDQAVPVDLTVPPHPVDAARPQDGSHGRDGPVVCAAFCTGCSDTETCFVSDFTAAACLEPCATTLDCAAGFTCAELVIDAADVGNQPPPYALSPRLCFSAAAHLPPVCGLFPLDTHCDLGGGASCADGTTLKQPVSAPGTCGYEYTHCPHACTDGAPDSGVMPIPTCS